jgi:cyclopropane fatty-acyl-phospholipid synthase-like methyltransferase
MASTRVALEENMADLFQEKAREWDVSQMRVQMSTAIGRAILAHVPLREDMTVLDFGAGTGLLSSHVAPRVKAMTAVDISASMLQKLADKPEFQGKVTTVCQDITQRPLPDRYDLIISAMAMHHVADTNRLFGVLARHLKPGGRIALADLDTEDGSFHSAGAEGVYHHGFARDALQAMLSNNGYTDIRFYTAHSIGREAKTFTVFLVTAGKGGC